MRSRPLAFARQQVFHPRAGAGQPGAHSGGLAVQHAGDLVGGVALDVVQVHGRAQVVGQLAHRVPDVGVARVAHELGDVVSYGIERHGAAVPVRFRQVAAAVDGHAQQPRLEVLGAGELGGIAVQPHEHVLVHVLGIGLRARLAQRQAVHGIAPIGHGARHEGLRAIRLRVVLCGHRSTPLPKHTSGRARLFQRFRSLRNLRESLAGTDPPAAPRARVADCAKCGTERDPEMQQGRVQDAALLVRALLADAMEAVTPRPR